MRTQLAPILTSLGVDVVSVLPQYNRVEGYIPWSALPAVSDLGSQGLMGIIGVEKPMTSAGSVTSEGVNVMEADRVQASTPGYDGSGVDGWSAQRQLQQSWGRRNGRLDR